MAKSVIRNDPKIVLNKLLKGSGYAIVVFLIMYAISFLQSGGLSPEYSFYAALLVIGLQSLMKGIEEYKPEYADKFLWFFEKILGPKIEEPSP